MFAVLKTGGKQYRVQSGDVLRVEKLAADAGETVQFNEVLMVGGDSPVVGTPLVEGAGVQAQVLDQIKADKVIHFVKRRRKHGSQRKHGHRQQLTVLRVTEIIASGAEASGIKAAVGAGSVAGRAMAAAAASVAAKAEKPAGKAKPAKAEKPAKADKPAKAKAAAPQPADVSEVAGSRPGNLLDAPRDGKADDLKKITGVGPKLESLLNDSGVYHYDQIAAWTADEIAYMDDKLSFKGRIERDGWIAQAAQLAAEKE
jgi:large subunit ribosomal protein L21